MEFLEDECDASSTGGGSEDSSSCSELSSSLSGFIVSGDEASLSDVSTGSGRLSHALPSRNRVRRVSSSSGSKDEGTGSGSQVGDDEACELARGRAFVFTWNNYEPAHEADLRSQCERGTIRYCCFGREKAPTTGTKHLQGVIYFINCRKFSGVRVFFQRLGGHGVHIEPMFGQLSQAITYCKKDGDFWEFGSPPKDAGGRATAGEREKKRWAAIRSACENQQYAELPDDYVCRYPGNPQRILYLKHSCASPPDRDSLVNYWLWGDSGTGKSRSARMWCLRKAYDLYLKDPTKWWDGYVGQQVVLFEEFGPDEAKQLGQYLKRWSDYYAFPGECKGAPSRLMRPAIVIVTSNYAIDELFPLTRDHEPLLRRFNVFHFEKDKENSFLECN